MFLAEFHLVLDLSALDDQLRLHVDEVLIVGELLVVEVSRQHGAQGQASLVNAALQEFCLFQLIDEFVPLPLDNFLRRDKMKKAFNRSKFLFESS